MPNSEYAVTMARYNIWQNESLVSAAASLDDSERRKDRGAFFGSIHQTFSHVLWGDMIWMNRFAGTPAPDAAISDSGMMIVDWAEFCDRRKAFDAEILRWAHTVSTEWFEGEISWYSGAVERQVTKPNTTLVVQFFNHQTHHRGQIHAMLTASGAKPDDTDVPFMPERYQGL